MSRNSVKRVVLVVFLAALMAACAKSGTRLTQEKVTDAFQGKPVSDILVIAVTDQENRIVGVISRERLLETIAA